ncbi:MAG: hypothetical protein AAGI17_03710 [Planctomycetota bacterium]
MSLRLCYLERADRGAALRAVRLVGISTDERWEAPPSLGEMDSVTIAGDAAGWLADRLGDRAGRGKGLTLDRLVVDADGGVCSWIAADHADRQLLETLVRERSGGESTPGLSELESDAGPPRFPDLPGEISIEPVARPEPREQNGSGGFFGLGKKPAEQQQTNGKKPGSSRVPVIAMPDVPARALADALDREGVDVVAPVSIWHVMAAAWDPAVESSQRTYSESMITSDQVSVAATVLIDHAGRLLWCWSISGTLLAAGSIRLARAVANGSIAARPKLTEAALSRLSAEWLSWSAQLGMSPQRVRLIADFDGQAGEGGLDQASASRVVSAAAPDAMGETIDEPDPIGLTLRRLAEQIDAGRLDAAEMTEDNGRTRLSTLSARPARAHKRMYRAIAALVFASAIAVTAGGLNLRSAAAAKRESTAAAGDELEKLIIESDVATLAGMEPQRLANDLDPAGIIDDVRDIIAVSATPPEGLSEFKPVVEQLDVFSFFVQSEPDLLLESLSIQQQTATITVIVPDTTAYENLLGVVNSLPGLEINFPDPTVIQNRDGGTRVSFAGTWKQPQEN